MYAAAHQSARSPHGEAMSPLDEAWEAIQAEAEQAYLIDGQRVRPSGTREQALERYAEGLLMQALASDESSLRAGEWEAFGQAILRELDRVDHPATAEFVRCGEDYRVTVYTAGRREVQLNTLPAQVRWVIWQEQDRLAGRHKRGTYCVALAETGSEANRDPSNSE